MNKKEIVYKIEYILAGRVELDSIKLIVDLRLEELDRVQLLNLLTLLTQFENSLVSK